MTSSHKLSTLSVWFIFLALWIHGATLGATDDEAYYWVLVQNPAFGYAYHPPAVAWTIWIFQKMFGWLLGTHSTAMLRLPACVISASMAALAIRWMRQAGAAQPIF